MCLIWRGAQNVRNGNYSVVAANHTLVLNWNAQTVPLLRQIAIHRRERADDTYKGCAGPRARLIWLSER
jgi:hypothetical protein